MAKSNQQLGVESYEFTELYPIVPAFVFPMERAKDAKAVVKILLLNTDPDFRPPISFP